MASRPGSPIAQGIVAVACLAVGMVLTFMYGLPMYRRAEASLNWPTTSGTVETSEVTSSFTKGKTKYSPSVSYSYDVNGMRQTSNSIWASGGDSSTVKSVHQAVVDKYPVGSTVKVFYDPEDPAYAILEPGITSTNYIVLGGGGATMLAGVIMAVATVVRLMRPAA
jgi:hypothetical protein